MNWITEWARSVPVITDGAWGTEMQARGLGIGEFPDAWNLTQPDKVGEVARAYVEAGSQVILTNTFGANRIRMEEAGLADRVADINRQGARVSGAAVQAARATGLPVVACMVFDAGQDKDRTMMGNTPEQVAALLTEAGADVIGSNCGQGVAGFVGLCRRLRAATDRPLWIKANAGLPEMIDGRVVYRTSAAEFAGYWSELAAAGASFIGGCCGTSPEFVRALVQAREST